MLQKGRGVGCKNIFGHFSRKCKTCEFHIVSPYSEFSTFIAPFYKNPHFDLENAYNKSPVSTLEMHIL